MVKSRYRNAWADSYDHVMVSPVGLHGNILFKKVLKERKAHMKGQAGPQLVFTGFNAMRHS